MEIKINQEKDSVTIMPIGRLDTITAPEFEQEIKKYISISNLHVDFKELDYISSAGLRVLLAAYKTIKKHGGTMKLYHLNDQVMEVFEITGFKKIFKL